MYICKMRLSKFEKYPQYTFGCYLFTYKTIIFSTFEMRSLSFILPLSVEELLWLRL